MLTPLWSTVLVLFQRRDPRRYLYTTVFIHLLSHHFSIHDLHSDVGTSIIHVFKFSCISAFSVWKYSCLSGISKHHKLPKIIREKSMRNRNKQVRSADGLSQSNSQRWGQITLRSIRTLFHCIDESEISHFNKSTYLFLFDCFFRILIPRHKP